MSPSLDSRTFQGKLERLDALLREAEHLADPSARGRFQEIVRVLLELHGQALEQLLEYVDAAGDAGRDILNACAGDDVVSGLLLLHGLHPMGLEARVQQALDKVRPYLRGHGGNVEILGVDGETVRLRLIGSCDGCPSSAATIKQTIEEAILARAPEVTTIQVEGLPAAAPLIDDRHARLALPIV